jgi:5'-3' exonuclease
VTHRALLDVSSLMYRAHFAMAHVVTEREGPPIGAVHGYLDMVTRLLRSRQPNEAVHVYDHDWRPTARVEIYADYKSKRPPEPEDLTVQFALLRDVLDLTGMPQAQTTDWEAEDTIGALVDAAAPDDLIEMVSGDRDLLQLVRDDPPPVRLLFTVRGVSELHEFDEAAVIAKYGVPASRYAEFAILRGDPSDGLPGVPGVGEKTARALINAYPTFDDLMAEAASTDPPRPGPFKGSPKLRARVRAEADYLTAMRALVPVNATAPMTLWSGERDDAALRDLAEREGLRGPVQRLLAALDLTSV